VNASEIVASRPSRTVCLLEARDRLARVEDGLVLGVDGRLQILDRDVLGADLPELREARDRLIDLPDRDAQRQERIAPRVLGARILHAGYEAAEPARKLHRLVRGLRERILVADAQAQGDVVVLETTLRRRQRRGTVRLARRRAACGHTVLNAAKRLWHPLERPWHSSGRRRCSGVQSQLPFRAGRRGT
jgi:hypothetical protein